MTTEKKLLCQKCFILKWVHFIYIFLSEEQGNLFGSFKGNHQECEFGYSLYSDSWVVSILSQSWGEKSSLIRIQPLWKPGFSGEGRKAITSQERRGIWQRSAQITLKCLSCSAGTGTRAYTPVTYFSLCCDLMNPLGKAHGAPPSGLWY